MEPTQALNFNIPKLKRQVTKDNLFEIDTNSRDAKELLDNIARTYLDQKYYCPWKVKNIQMVRNPELEQEYKAKRTDMKEEGRHSRELVDQIAFCAIKEPSYITKIAKNGMMTKNLPFSILGEHKSGVYLTKHADVQLKMVETISSQTITALFVFNAILGKCKAVNERLLHSAEPTPNYDCHIPLQPAQPSDPHIIQLQRSQIYLYEYDDDGMPAPRPRQCLPHAVITYEKIDNFTVGPLKSIYCYDPNKNKKGEDKADWKKTPRNMSNPQLPFSKNPTMDNQIRSSPAFGPLGWSAATPGGPAQGIPGAMNQAPFTPDAPPHDLEPGMASNLLLNYPQQTAGVDAQGVVVHRSGSDPRKRFQQNIDEPPGVSEQQRNLPPQQPFPNFRPGYSGNLDYQYSNDGPKIDNMTGWEPKAPQGFYSECEPTDNTSSPWHQSGPYNNNFNNNNFNNNNFNNNNFNNNNFNNNNSNNVGNNRYGPSWMDSGPSNFEKDDQMRLKPGNTNCDNKSTNNTTNKSSVPESGAKKSIPFALKKKKPAPSTSAASSPKTQEKDDQKEKTKDSSPAESDTKSKTANANKKKVVNSANKKKVVNSTDSDSKPKSQGKVQETAAKNIPFPKKTLLATQVSEEPSKSQPNLQDNHVQDLFTKLLQAESKDNIDTLNFSGKGKNTKSSKVKGSAAGQLPEKAFSLHDYHELELKKLQELIKEKIKSTKENDKKASKNNQPKIKTTLSSLKQGLKTTILLPTPGKNNEENGPKLETLTKLLNIVDSAVSLKTQPEVTTPTWEVNYLSFLKTVQKMDLTPGQHHKWVRKKEPPPEPPLLEKVPPPLEPTPPEKIPPPPPAAAEVSIDDVINTKLMKELLLEQDFSESTSVSEADSLYLPPTERSKKRKANSMTTRRQAKKKAPFDMSSYRRRRKRQKMQRKAAAEFDTSSLASTTSSFGFGDYSQNFWESDFDMETSLPSDNLAPYGKETKSQEPPLLSYGREMTSREPTLKDLGFESWKDAVLCLKFQPVVALKDCVQQITSHLHQEGGSNMMEWIGSQKELLETLNLPPDHSHMVTSSVSGSKATTQGKSNLKTATTTSKMSVKTKPSKINMMDYPSTNETISINSIKASVRSEINKIKKMSSKKNTPSGLIKKKIAKPKAPPIEIPRIKAKLPEKKPDSGFQLPTNSSKDIKKPVSSSTTSGSTSLTLPSKSTLSGTNSLQSKSTLSGSNTLQSKSTLSNANKTIPTKGIIKNVRSDSAVPKTSAVSPATFPPTDQSLKVDLLMEIISAPPTTTTSAFELEQKRIAEQKKAAEQKKQKISFQAYMEKHVKAKPVKSPPHEKTNVFEAFKDFILPEKDLCTKPVSEPSLITSPTTAPLLEKLKPALVMPPAVTTPSPAVVPYLEKLKPSLVMPPNTGTFTNSLFSPLSPPPPPPIPRDPRLPSKLPLPFPKDPPLPKIIPTIPKPAKEDLKPILKEKSVKSSSISHKKAPLQKTLTIPLEDPNESSQIVDPRLCRKTLPSQPDFHPVKEPQSKPSSVNDPLLPRDPRLLKIYGEYQSDGVVGNKLGKTPTQDAPADIYNPMKLKSCLSEGVSDVISKSKPLIKNNTWNLRAIYTGDDTPKPPRRPVSTSEEHSLHKSTKRPKPGTPTEVFPVYAQKIFSKDIPKDSKPSTVPLENIKEETVKLESESVKSESAKPESVKTESLKSESQEASIDRQAWGFYREMSPKRSGSEDANSSDKFKPSLLNEKSDENSGSDMDIASESPQVLYFSNSDSDSNMIGEDLTKPLYIDMSASATPRRDSFESYKFSLKSPEHSLKKSDIVTDPRKSTGIEMREKTEVFKNPLAPTEPVSTQNTEEKLSPFNETVPPVDPEAKNTLNSSLFCAYQMEGQAELRDTSHIWMKSLSNLSKVQAVSNVHISDETLDVLRKVFKENIPAAAPKDFSQSTPFPTIFPPTKETSVKKSDKDLHKPGTLNKDYKLGGLDKDLFKSSSPDGGSFSAEGVFKSESVDINSAKSESSIQPGVIENRFGNDEKLTKKTTMASQGQSGNFNQDKTENQIINCKTEMYSPTHPTMDEMSEKPPAESADNPQSEQLIQGQAIPVLNLSRKKQPPKKSRSLSPTTTLPSPTQYLSTSSGWMAPQQAPPFWSNFGLNQKFDGVWQNLPPFNPIMTTSHPTPPIWPHPVTVAPTLMGNIPFPPPGYVNPDLASYQTNQPDISKPSNVYDWFADKIHFKGEAANNENNTPKIKDPHVESVSKFLTMLSKPGNVDLPFISSVPTQGPSSKLVPGSSGAETKNTESNLGNAQIPKSESFSELASINTSQDNSNSKADSEKSRSSSYSPTDKTSEIVSISASDPSMSPGHLDSIKSAEKGVGFNLKRTISIDSSLSSESCSRFSKIDSLKKVEEKQPKPDLSALATASPSSNDDSEDDVWQKKSATQKENKSDLPGLKAERKPSSSEPGSSTLIIDSAAGQQDADTSFSENYDSATNEDSKRTKGESSEAQNKLKSRTRSRSRSRSGRKKSSDIPKSVQISTINSKSLKDIKLAQSNRELLRKLAEQFSEKKGKSDLQNLLESVKKIKKELASQSSDEKESSVGKSSRKSSQSPRHRSEEKNSSSRSKKSEDKCWSEKLWKPVQPVGENPPATTASISSTSSKSNSNKLNSKRLSTESSSSKTSEKPKKDVSEELDDKVSRSSKEDRNCDSELEEGELPDEESQSSEEEETVSEEYSKHRSSRRKSESVHRKRRQPERRHSSQGERFHKRRKLKSRKEEGMSPEDYPHERMDSYKRGSPDRYGHDRMESYPRSRMDYHTMDNPAGHPGDRRDYHPMDNPDGRPDDRMDYPHDSSEDCSPERSGFYPPNRSDNYKNGRPENFIHGKQKRFHEKRGRIHGKFAPYSHKKSGHYREESNNYSDDDYTDYGPDDKRDRNPWGRSDSYPYGNHNEYGQEKFGASHDPDDYIQDKDGLLYEKSDEYLPFKKGYSHNWPDRHPRGRRGGSYSPSREEGYPNDGHFMGNDPPPREGRFLGNGSPPRDGHFLGNCSPPRQEGPLHQGMYPPDNWSTASHLREIKVEVKNNGNKGQKGIGGSVSGGNLAAETLPNMEQNEATISSGPVSYGNPHMQTGPINLPDEDDPKMKLTFDTIDSYLKMFVQAGSREYKVLKSALGVPLETNFNSLSKTKRKKIRKKIQSQLQALIQAPGIVNNEERRQEPDSTFYPATERPSFQMEDFQNFSSFEGNPNSMEHLKSWLNQRPDEDQFLRSRSLSETRDDSEDEVNPPGGAADNPEVVAIADPEIRRAVRMVSWMEKSPGFGTPHQRIPQKLLLAEEKDNLFSFEGCFLILMRKIPRKAVERLATLREVLNFLTCELQAAQKANDLQKFHKLQATKNKLHERRKDVLEKFTGTINPQRLQTIKDAKDMYVDCLEYLKRRPDPLPNVDKEFVVKSIKAIQGHISMTKKFLDEQQASNNPVPPPLSSIGFCPDRQGPPPHSAQDVGWSWFGPRNMDQPMPGCYNQQRNNGPF